MGMGSQNSSGSQTQQITVPSWLTEGQQNLVGQSQDLTSPFLNLPAFRTAGFTPDQTNAFDLTRTMAMNAFNNPGNRVDASGAYVSPARMGAAQGTAAQLGATDYQKFLNPYTQDVINSTLGNMYQQKDQQQADIGARAAAGGAYGGSREAVQDSLLNKNFNNTLAQTVAGLESQGFDKATATAAGNTNLQQQTAMANTQNQQQAQQYNAQLAQQAAMQNANTTLQIPQINQLLTGQNNQQQMNALNAMLGTGGAQQQLAQQSLNVPWTTLQQLASILTPSLSSNTDRTTNTTGSSTSSGSAGAMQMLGLAGSVLCHAEGTPIRMQDGSLKNVENLELGDTVLLGGQVMGHGKAIGTDLYRYKDTVVQGRHAVLDGTWARVADCPDAKSAPDLEGSIVYPIVTENHLLATETYICADLIEHDGDETSDGKIALLNADAERNKLLAFFERAMSLKAAA